MLKGVTLKYYQDNYGTRGECKDYCPEGTGPYGSMTEVCVPCPVDFETCSGGICIACDK